MDPGKLTVSVPEVTGTVRSPAVNGPAKWRIGKTKTLPFMAGAFSKSLRSMVYYVPVSLTGVFRVWRGR